MRRQPWIAVTALLIASCIPSAAPQPSPSPSADAGAGSPSPLPATGLSDMSAVLLAKPLPYADGFVLTRTVRGRDGLPAKGFEPVRTTPPIEDVGTVREFWTYDFQAKKNVKTTATLRIMTEHAKWWVAIDANIDIAGLRTTATSFETKIYPTDRRLYGEEWSPGIDGDPRINLVDCPARPPAISAGPTRSRCG